VTETLLVRASAPAPGVLVLAPDGALDLPTAANLRRSFDREIGSGGVRDRVVVDLAQVAFLGSAGVAVLLDIAETVAGWGGRLSLTSPSPAARRVLGLLRLERELPVHDSLQEALGA